MSDLAPFVLTFMKDQTIVNLMQENQKIDQFRSMIRYVNVQALGPNPDPSIFGDEHLDGEGFYHFFWRRVDMSSDGQESNVVTLEGRGFHPLDFSIIAQMKVRFGDLFESRCLGDYKSSLFLTCAWCNREHRAYLEFQFEFGDPEEEKISVLGTIGAAVNEVSIHDFSILSGMSVGEIIYKCNHDRAHAHGYVKVTEDQYRVPVQREVLEKCFVGRFAFGGFHYEVASISLPFNFLKKKCHLV